MKPKKSILLNENSENTIVTERSAMLRKVGYEEVEAAHKLNGIKGEGEPDTPAEMQAANE